MSDPPTSLSAVEAEADFVAVVPEDPVEAFAEYNSDRNCSKAPSRQASKIVGVQMVR